MAETASDRARVLELHRDGWGVAHIARKAGLGRGQVWKILRDAGVTRPAHLTRANARGEDLANPGRADAALRRF